MKDLFGDEKNNWAKEWIGMPEFVQEKQEPYAKIILRIKSKEDLERLSKLLEQPFTSKTKSAWFPAIVRGINSNKRYVNES